MPRVTRDQVLEIIETDLTTPQVDAFLNDANTWVTDFLGGEGLSAARLAAIEKYLTAHYITLRDPRIRSQTIEDVSETLQRNPQVTEYLMQAIAEDPTGIVRGKLLDQKNAATVSFRVGVYDPD